MAPPDALHHGRHVIVATTDELEALVRRAIEPLRLTLERHHCGDTSPCVTIEEAARLLGKSRRTIQRWLKDGRLQGENVGGTRLVRLPPGVNGR